MFDTLSDRFDTIFTRLRGKGRLSDADVDEVLREIRVALLEADTSLEVVRTFLDAVRTRCSGTALQKSLTPAQQVIKIVNEELVSVLGGEAFRISYAGKPPTIILLAGLQGSGKTTTAAKLARYFKKEGRHPLLVGADLQRPAAVEQLRVLGRDVGVAVFSEPSDPVAVARQGIAEAERVGRDVVIIDTAGRLTIDDALMDELRRVSAAVDVHYRLLVLDAMTGQDALQTARAFDAAIPLDGVIMTKLDGDARGGAALSARTVVGRPIAFVSTGETSADFEAFYPDRMASRILGLGDVLSLIEKAEQEYDAAVAEKTVAKLRAGRFSLEDFHDQLQQMKKMGPLQNVLGMLPGLPKEVRNASIEDKDVSRVEAIIRSMTPTERDEPGLIDGSRRARIAAGSGTTAADVNNLLRQFKEMQRLMQKSGLARSLSGGGAKGRKQKGGRVTPSRRDASFLR